MLVNILAFFYVSFKIFPLQTIDNKDYWRKYFLDFNPQQEGLFRSNTGL